MGSYSSVALGSRSLAATIDLITRGNFDETKKARKDLHDGYEKALNSQSFCDAETPRRQDFSAAAR